MPRCIVCGAEFQHENTGTGYVYKGNYCPSHRPDNEYFDRDERSRENREETVTTLENDD